MNLGEVLDASARKGLERQMSVAGWSDPVGKVLWGRVPIFRTEVIAGNLRNRIHPHLKKKRTTDLAKDQFQPHHITLVKWIAMIS